MTVIVRPIEIRDAPGYRECLDAVAREKRYLAQVEALPLEKVEAFVRESVEADSIQFVAVEGSRVVGWADIFPHWAAALAHCGTLGMGVHADYRGQGIGARLLCACLDKASGKGITRIELQARADNARAIRLYERAGFVAEARLRNAMRFDGIYYEALQMSLVRPPHVGSST
jgi:RimJ/RimL family protein N-acetyltransferase